MTSSSKNANRFSRRKVARSDALFKVRNEDAQLKKRDLTEQELDEFVTFIVQNQNGKFGIGKLKDLNLNSRLERD